jgi:DNA-directed RNA polymerase subunit RPC12/RpoP
MNVTYHCPACSQTVRARVTAESDQVACPRCQQQISVSADAIEAGQIHRCLVCPSTELFARKDFPQRLGVALVVAGFVGSSIAWANYQVLWTFAILFATALVDLLLYIVMGESLTCYRCHAQYRGFDEIERHGGFDLETHERYRQMAARMKNKSTQSTSLSTEKVYQ